MALRLVHEVQRRQVRRERVFRDRTNPLDSLNDDQLLERYRFRRNDIFWLVDTFGAELEHQNERKGLVPSYMQVMVALRVFATGCFQLDVGDTFGISKPTVCRIVRNVATVISGAMTDYVKFETGVEAERTQLAFYKMAGFPKVVGCIDCTHIKILAPTTNEHEFINRKGVHSINVQLVCNADMKIMNAVVKWPGKLQIL